MRKRAALHLRRYAPRKSAGDFHEAAAYVLFVGFLFLIGILAWVTRGAAAPPENADPALAPFYKSLKQPGTAMSCCDLSDCRTVAITYGEGKRWAFIGTGFPNAPNTWVEVPDAVVIQGVENPTGGSVACFFGGKVQCFVPGSGV